MNMAHNIKASRKRNNDFTLKWWMLTITISFIISAIIIWAMHILLHPAIKEISANNIFNIESNGPALPSIKNKTVILAMGVDSNGIGTDPFKATRTDTMILASLDPKKKTVGAISIPRDCKVFLAGGKGIDKINAAHAYGGPELAVKTVEETLGINIDHYIVIDYKGLKELIKALDGVEVFIEKRMKYTDHAGKLYIDLQPGKQLLDADHSEMYLRFRHDEEGDIGRIKRQQWFMKGVLEKIKSPSIVFKLPQLIEVAKKYVKTDMSVSEMLKLAGFAKEINFDKVQISTLPGSPSLRSAISYWIIDVNAAQVLIDKLIHGYQEIEVSHNNGDEQITLSVMYNQDKQEDLDLFIDELKTANYKIVCKNKTKEVHTKIMAHSNRATLDESKLLKQNSKNLSNATVFLVPNTTYCAPSDYTIVLGKDQ